MVSIEKWGKNQNFFYFKIFFSEMDKNKCPKWKKKFSNYFLKNFFPFSAFFSVAKIAIFKR
jgi:hypothetical protein